jgi:hypothetical protein
MELPDGGGVPFRRRRRGRYTPDMSFARWAPLASLLLVLLVVGPSPDVRADDLSELELSGDWYVLLHFKDAKSEDKSLVKFKDFAWSIQQDPERIVWTEYPYVIFDEGTEVTRRYKMRAHEPWEPEGLVLGLLQKHLDVSSRAERSKTLKGSCAAGFRSPPAIGSGGGARTLTFTRDWSLAFAADKVSVRIVDSLGGSDLLGEMQEATLYEITQRVSDGELRGTYAEGTKSGRLRMIRSKERRVVK